MAVDSHSSFRVALTADFYNSDQQCHYPDIGLSLLAEAGIPVQRFDRHRPIIEAGQWREAQGIICLTPRVTAASLTPSDDLLVIGRFGVGYDSVDVAACTASDVMLCIAAGAVDRPVAEATVGWIIALTHHIRTKDHLVRTGRWDDRNAYMGTELRDRTLGIVGCGGIGKAVLQLLSSFNMNRPLVYDPCLTAEAIAALGAEPVTLDDLLRRADFVSIHCPLNAQSRGLIAARELALMKPTAYLINTARGGIVDESALYAALCERRIAGAAIDCFEQEPILSPPKWATLDNVILAPHSIAWTHEMFRDIGRCACQVMIDLSQHRVPAGIVNREVLDRPSFQDKWRRLCPK